MALLLRVGVGLVVGGGGALLVRGRAGMCCASCAACSSCVCCASCAAEAPICPQLAALHYARHRSRAPTAWVQASRVMEALQQARARVQAGRTPCGNPLPREVHAVLPPSETANRRIIIVGDIHGCAGGAGREPGESRQSGAGRGSRSFEPGSRGTLPSLLSLAQPPPRARSPMLAHVRAAAAEELAALLAKVGYRRGVDLLLSVGDLVNKGPDSEKVGAVDGHGG